MTTPHRATTEEWEAIELASVPREIAPGVTMHHAITVVAAGLVDIRARIEALEQLHQAVVDLNEQFSLEPLVARIDALEAAQGRAIRQPMQQPVSVDLDENDRRFRAVLAAIDNATPEQLHHAAPADHSRGTTEMVGPATDAELLDAQKRLQARLAELKAELKAKPTANAATEPAVAPAAKGTRSALIAAPLDWNENLPSCEECRYDHCKASTPFGDFLITWKGWKDNDHPTVAVTPWESWGGHFISVQEAKQWCQAEYEKRLQACFVATTEPAPPQPGGIVRDGVSWGEREGREQFIQPAGPAEYQATQAAFSVGLVERVGRAIDTAVDVGDGKEARAAICEVVAWLRETGNHGSARDLELEVTR